MQGRHSQRGPLRDATEGQFLSFIANGSLTEKLHDRKACVKLGHRTTVATRVTYVANHKASAKDFCSRMDWRRGSRQGKKPLPVVDRWHQCRKTRPALAAHNPASSTVLCHEPLAGADEGTVDSFSQQCKESATPVRTASLQGEGHKEAAAQCERGPLDG
jgi:hypothetical protein